MKLELDVKEVELVLNALAAQPYAQVFGLIAKIQMQAQSQLDQKQPAPAE